MKLEELKTITDLRKVSPGDLHELADDVRDLIIETTSKREDTSPPPSELSS